MILYTLTQSVLTESSDEKAPLLLLVVEHKDPVSLVSDLTYSPS